MRAIVKKTPTHECRLVVLNLCYIPELSRKLLKNKDAFEHMIYIYIGHTSGLEAMTLQRQYAQPAPTPWFLNTTSHTERNQSPLETQAWRASEASCRWQRHALSQMGPHQKDKRAGLKGLQAKSGNNLNIKNMTTVIMGYI